MINPNLYTEILLSLSSICNDNLQNQLGNRYFQSAIEVNDASKNPVQKGRILRSHIAKDFKENSRKKVSGLFASADIINNISGSERQSRYIENARSIIKGECKARPPSQSEVKIAWYDDTMPEFKPYTKLYQNAISNLKNNTNFLNAKRVLGYIQNESGIPYLEKYSWDALNKQEYHELSIW